MVITYHGKGCVKIQSGETSLLLDPVNNRLKATIVLHSTTSLEGGETFEASDIRFPGEYESHGVSIEGVQISEESTAAEINTAYVIIFEDISLVALGGISKMPSVAVLERLGEPDIVMGKVEKGGLDTADAVSLLKKLEPSIVIPLGSEPGALLKAMGQKGEPQEKLVIKKKELVPEEVKVVVLTAE